MTQKIAEKVLSSALNGILFYVFCYIFSSFLSPFRLLKAIRLKMYQNKMATINFYIPLHELRNKILTINFYITLHELLEITSLCQLPIFVIFALRINLHYMLICINCNYFNLEENQDIYSIYDRKIVFIVAVL